MLVVPVEASVGLGDEGGVGLSVGIIVGSVRFSSVSSSSSSTISVVVMLVVPVEASVGLEVVGFNCNYEKQKCAK